MRIVVYDGTWTDSCTHFNVNLVRQPYVVSYKHAWAVIDSFFGIHVIDDMCIGGSCIEVTSHDTIITHNEILMLLNIDV